MYIREILFLVVTISATIGVEQPLLEISNGLLQGTLDKSYNGRVFSSFEGVPYAKPPIGKLRFEPPREPYNWTGTWIANVKHACISSFNQVHLEVTGYEDCLHLNVYVPREVPSNTDNLDVIVHIHGGAFMLGSGHEYAGPKYLMDEEVILVTINYRLGPFGFLSTADEIQPGNLGLKDQVQAFKWIQKNIKFFGGNPNSVTLTGMSAGGASVHYHYLSPLSKGLFHRGISGSGTALHSWALQKAAPEKAKRLAALVGCPTDTSRSMIRCLRWRPADTIAEAVKKFFVYDSVPFSPFGPVVEIAHPGAFLSEHPYTVLSENRAANLPWITSVNEREGIYPAALLHDRFPQLNQEIDEVLPHILDYNYTVATVDKSTVTNSIKGHYFKESVTLQDLITVCGDRHFKIEANAAAKLQAKTSKVYFYIFNYRGQHSFSELFYGAGDNIGVSHGDEVQYYLDTRLTPDQLLEADEKMKSIFLKFILSFVRTNEPAVDGVTWEPVTQDETLNALHLASPEEIVMVKEEDLGRHKFWSTLPLHENEKIAKLRVEL